MRVSFLDHIEEIEDHRVPGMTTYPLDEVLVTVLVGLLCRGEDFDEIEMICGEHLGWLRRFPPFREGIAPARTLRRVPRALDPVALEGAFAGWVASLQDKVAGVVAIDGKTLRGSKQDKSGAGALHMISAHAHASGLVLAQRAVGDKSNEIAAIPELLDMLEIEGAIVTIDAIGTQTALAGKSSSETRLYISSLPPDPARILAASRSHWSIENNLHWQLDVTFREDPWRSRKDHAARNLATMRKAVLNLLRREPSKLSLKRKRLKAAINPTFRQAILAR